MIELLVIGGIVAVIAKACSSCSSSLSSSSDFVRSPEVSGEFYEFDYRNVDGEWRAYIVDQPSYQGRDTDAHTTHRLRDENGEQYVCWSDSIQSEEECRSVAHQWVRCTDRYIATGERF